MNQEMDYEKELNKFVFLEKKFVKVDQGMFSMYLMSFTAEELIQYTAVHYFKPVKNNKGYQRQLITNHYRKIAKYVEAEEEPILPPAILTATDPEFISDEKHLLKINRVIRVVDGQHRIQGLRYLKENDREAFYKVAQYEFPVILMVIEEGQRIHEVNTFVNINSKGKKVSTDLAILLRDRIREEEFNNKLNYLNEKDFEEAIATNISKNLNETKDCVWYDLIKMAGGDDDKGKPISINAFNQSIKDLVRTYIKASAAERTKDHILIIVSELSPLIASAWDSVARKWSECFHLNKRIKHNELFNIQKGIGVYPIHQLLYECMLLNESDIDESLKEFRGILKKSEVEYNEWKIGGILSSYNSRAGFKTIAAYIKNEIDLFDLQQFDE